MLRSALDLPVRVRIAIAVGIILCAAVLSAATVDAQLAPSLTVDGTPDPATGMIFDLEFRDLNTAGTSASLVVELTRDGVPVPLSMYGPLFTNCPKVNDPNDPGLTHACSFTALGESLTATYEVTAFVTNGNNEMLVASTAVTGFRPWWHQFTLTSDQNIFTGFMDVTIEFDTTPASVSNIALQAMVPGPLTFLPA